MARLSDVIRLLRYYWWQKQDERVSSKVAELLDRLESGGTLTDEERLWLYGDANHPYEAPAYMRLLAPVAKEFDELDAALEQVRRSRDVDWAWGWVLDTLAMNVGVKRPRNFYAPGPLEDAWMRQMVKLFVFCQNSKGTIDEIIIALAWWLGIAWRNPNWHTYIPQIRIFQNNITAPTARTEPQYLEIHAPWRLFMLYVNDHLYVANTDGEPVGQGFWVSDPERGLDYGLTDGHHLLTDSIAFLRHIVPAGTRFEVFGTGFYVADTDSEPEGQGFWVPDSTNGFDVGRIPGLLEDGALEDMYEEDYEQLRVAPYAYSAMHKELLHWHIRYKDEQFT